MTVHTGLEIAVVGMACRFPGGDDIAQFWETVSNGVEHISTFAEHELEESGVAAEVRRRPDYVPRGGVVEGTELFDNRLFGYAPREATHLDPQQRMFLETAWEALDNAGYGDPRYRGVTGVYAGSGPSLYLMRGLIRRQDAGEVRLYDLLLANDKDYVASRVAYHLGLTGPCLTVQTACSTSLVAVHLAGQALLAQECDLALAGGAMVRFPRRAGYRYQPGDVVAADGHTYAFDARATGFVPGEGVGVVVLKRLTDALRDGDVVHAVIKGSAVTNDGSAKVGFTAPGVEGQSTTIRMAHQVSDVEPSTIGYLEAHGTGTAVGDPIEFTALCRAFGDADRQYCALGSVKALVGHMDAAAGVGGLIKAVLAVRHGVLPPSPYFDRPNPAIDLARSPFYVNTTALPWPSERRPRRAGVSSFGIGGTNAHAIVEEPPAVSAGDTGRPDQLFVLSAQTATALDRMRERLAEVVPEHPASLADMAHTLRVGRRPLGHRTAFVCRTRQEAVEVLAGKRTAPSWSGVAETRDREVVFMFPGQGAQHPGMARELYEQETTFRRTVDACAELLVPHLDQDLREVIYDERSRSTLDQTRYTQPALFVIEYALAQLWLEWGLRPRALIGHSVGEYVAACVGGVLELPDALALIAARGRLLQRLPAGAMLSVHLPAAAVEPMLPAGAVVAADNAPQLCTVAGPAEQVERLRHRLQELEVPCRLLHTTRAFHSPMVDPILDEFADCVGRHRLAAPVVPIVSNVTGEWLSAQDATDAGYWVRQLRRPVRFSRGIELLLGEGPQIMLEVGPGETLATLARQHETAANDHHVLTSLPPARKPQPDRAYLLATLGRAWVAGAAVDWTGLVRHERRLRTELPAYPFERERFWIDLVPVPAPSPAPAPDVPRGPAPGYPQEEVRDLRQSIREVWRDALGVADFGDGDDFFSLGGHSLLATRVLARIRPLAGVDLRPDAIFEAPTVEQLAGLIERERGEPAEDLEGLLPELLAELQQLSTEDTGVGSNHRD